MMIFISGASRSGKSEKAENICMKLAAELNNSRKIYLATAQVYDDDMRRRVERHKLMRRDKNFITIEKTHNLHEILDFINNTDTVLLECLPNLAANELFSRENFNEDFSEDLKGFKDLDLNKIKNKIFNTILDLNSKCANLIIVSDDIFSDGIIYDEMTESYIKLLGALHVLIAAEANQAIECASGFVNYFKK